MDPARAPRPARRRILSNTVALGTVLAVIAASSAAGRSSTLVERFPAARWLPAAGHHERLADATGSVTTIEWALGTGYTVLQSGPVALIMAADSLDELAVLELARAGWVTTGADGTARSHGDDLMAVTQAGVETRVTTSGEEFLVFAPPRLELPTGVRPGQVWRSSGSVSLGSGAGATQTLDYRLVGSADVPADEAAASSGCLDVTLRETIASEPDSLTRRTWCPASGIVAISGASGTWRSTDAPPSASPAWHTTTQSPDWAAAPHWAIATGSAARQPPLHLTPAVSPVLLPGDVIVYANETGHDLVAITLGVDSPNATWHAHPGGEVTALGAFGDIVIAATTSRRLVAYGPGGEWLWTRPLADVTEAALVPFGEELVVFAGLDGTVAAYQVRSGERRWVHRMPNEVRRTPVVAADRVYVLDQAGNLDALGLTGSPAWSASAEMADSYTVSADHLVVASAVSNRILGLALADGAEVWRRSFPGAKDDLTPVADSVVMRTTDGVVAVRSATGEELWRRAGQIHGLTSGAGYAAIVGADAVELLDRNGQLVAKWPHGLGDLDAGPSTFLTAGAGKLAVIRGDQVVGLGVP